MLNINSIYDDLTQKIDKTKIFIFEPMNKHTSFKVGGNADIFIKPTTTEEIINILKIVNINKVPLTIIGNGTNVLVKDNGIRGIVIKPDIQEIYVKEKESGVIIEVGTGILTSKFAREFSKKGYEGLEFCSGIPGTIGGAVRMNAGAYGREMKDIIISTTYINENGKIEKIENSQQEFEYRKSIFKEKKWIIIKCEIEINKGNIEEIENKIKEYTKSRKENQPLEFPSAGSTFKRGKDYITSKLIDKCGLKGYNIGDAFVSEKHAGFIVNKGNATAKDIIDLIKVVKKQVKEKFNEEIEEEIEIIGED